MRLRLTTPTKLVVDREVAYVQAEDPSGRFGILNGHENFLTTLVPSILIYRYEDGGAKREAYAAVRSGVLRVDGDDVQVAVRDARVSDDLSDLEEEVRRSRKAQVERSYRSTRSLYQMQLAAWRRMLEYKDVSER